MWGICSGILLFSAGGAKEKDSSKDPSACHEVYHSAGTLPQMDTAWSEFVAAKWPTGDPGRGGGKA